MEFVESKDAFISFQAVEMEMIFKRNKEKLIIVNKWNKF